MNSECSICFELVRSSETQKPSVTRCGHLFHENCIKNCLHQGVGKCPQCNQKIVSSQLIRLFINEPPETSSKVKDELIEQLRTQLNELNEKAQLQYDLIGALNRNIKLLEPSQQEADEGSATSHATSTSTSRKLSFPKPVIAASKLMVQKREDAINVQRRSATTSDPFVNAFSNSATTFGPSKQSSFDFSNNSTKPATLTPFGLGKSTLNCYQANRITEASQKQHLNAFAPRSGAYFNSLQVPLKDSSNITEASGLAACPQIAKSSNASSSQCAFTFGSGPTFDNLQFPPKDSANKPGAESGLASLTRIADGLNASYSQSANLFAPTSTTSKFIPMFKLSSSSSTITAKTSFDGRPHYVFELGNGSTVDSSTNCNSSSGTFIDFFKSLPKSTTLSGCTSNDEPVQDVGESSDQVDVKLEKDSPKKK